MSNAVRKNQWSSARKFKMHAQFKIIFFFFEKKSIRVRNPNVFFFFFFEMYLRTNVDVKFGSNRFSKKKKIPIFRENYVKTKNRENNKNFVQFLKN